MSRFLLLILSLFLLIGCTMANTPLFTMYTGSDIIKEQSGVATIITRYGVKIDGQKPTEENYYNKNANLKEELRAYDVLPGEHLLELSYTPAPRRASMGGGYVSTTYV